LATLLAVAAITSDADARGRRHRHHAAVAPHHDRRLGCRVQFVAG